MPAPVPVVQAVAAFGTTTLLLSGIHDSVREVTVAVHLVFLAVINTLRDRQLSPGISESASALTMGAPVREKDPESQDAVSATAHPRAW